MEGKIVKTVKYIKKNKKVKGENKTNIFEIFNF